LAILSGFGPGLGQPGGSRTGVASDDPWVVGASTFGRSVVVGFRGERSRTGTAASSPVRSEPAGPLRGSWVARQLQGARACVRKLGANPRRPG
jgi:hypothetical protein